MHGDDGAGVRRAQGPVRMTKPRGAQVCVRFGRDGLRETADVASYIEGFLIEERPRMA